MYIKLLSSSTIIIQDVRSTFDFGTVTQPKMVQTDKYCKSLLEKLRI